MALPGTTGPSRADIERTVEKMLFEKFGVLHHHRIAGVVQSEAGGVPTGTVLATARSTAPAGYLLCDGAAVSRTDFEALFDAISTTYGAGDGSTTFNLPDLRGRAPVGVDGAAARLAFSDTLGASNGEEFHTLIVGEMPAHTHGMNHLSFNQGGAGAINRVFDGDASDVQTASRGGGGAHYNMPPYQVVEWMVKT